MCLTSVATVTTAVFNLIIESKVILILFYYLANQIFVPIILGQISKQFSIPNNLLDVLKKINLRCIFWGVVWDLGVRVCMPRCALIHHLLAYLDIRNINYQIIISLVKMVHMVETQFSDLAIRVHSMVRNALVKICSVLGEEYMIL